MRHRLRLLVAALVIAFSASACTLYMTEGNQYLVWWSGFPPFVEADVHIAGLQSTLIIRYVLPKNNLDPYAVANWLRYNAGPQRGWGAAQWNKATGPDEVWDLWNDAVSPVNVDCTRSFAFRWGAVGNWIDWYARDQLANRPFCP